MLLVHIVTSLLDPFAGIKLIDAVIPFTGSYRPIWLGLGAFASDLFIAVALTSVVRRRLGHGAWRATHWLAYVCWPVAIVHTVGTGSDVKQTWLLALTADVRRHRGARRVGADRARLARAARRCAASALVASIALPVIFVAWLPGGPLGKDWAARAGTPARDLQRVSATTTVPNSSANSTPSTQIAAFAAHVNGTVAQGQTASGLVQVDIALAVANPRLGTLHVRIDGTPAARRRRADDREQRLDRHVVEPRAVQRRRHRPGTGHRSARASARATGVR